MASDASPARPTGAPEYDFAFIAALEGLIVEGEAGWRTLFTEMGLEPREVVYEDLETADGYQAAVRSIADHLDVSLSDVAMPSPRSHRQADSVNEAWLDRYHADQAGAALS